MAKAVVTLLIVFFVFATGCRKDRQREVLTRVDKALRQTPIVQEEASVNLDSLAREAEREKRGHSKVEKLIRVSDEYKAYDLEKAMRYILEANEIAATDLNNPLDSVKTMMRLASLFNTEGLMVKEAADIFKVLNPEEMPPEMLLNYYILGVQINKRLADRAFEPRLKEIYRQQASAFRDSVLRLEPDNTIIAANRLLENGEIKEALQLMLSRRPGEGEDGRPAPYYHYLAGLYGQMERQDSQIYYLALASEDDLRHGVKDYIALTQLADLLMERGDLERAHRYIERSRIDAEASRSALRQREVRPVYNKINRAYSERQKRFTNAIFIISLALLVIVVSVAVSVVALRRKNRELKEKQEQLEKSGRLLENANNQLARSNERLWEESRVKSVYINSFMELCLSYLGKMESFRARLGKIASGGDLRKVVEAINSSRYVNKEVAEFYGNFDKAFLSLYPDYISRLNTLLRLEERYPESEKLSTELRVYALIWLGIGASGEISKFLRCSESTVYNYRTQMRNRAIRRDKFEEEFQEMSQNLSTQASTEIG